MSDNFALFFGAIIVAAFSYGRFNLATYEGDERIDRLVALVTPDKLRARGTVLKAFIFYVVMLLIIYAFLCAYAELLPLLGGPSIGSDLAGAKQLPTQALGGSGISTGYEPLLGSSSEAWAQPASGAIAGESEGVGISPSVSLTVALVVVGLAPTFPVLKRFDEWMRSVAHQMAGIPTWVIGASKLLRGPLGIDDKNVIQGGKEGSLLIDHEDWLRLRTYRTVLEGVAQIDDSDLWNDLDLIFYVSSWVLDERLSLSKPTLRARFRKLETSLKERKDAIVQRFDGLISSYQNKENADAGAIGENIGAANNNWESLSKSVEDLADDLRILIALYVEHGIIENRRFQPRTPGQANQHDTAMVLLQNYTGVINARVEPSEGTLATPAWMWTSGLAVGLAIVWSLTIGGAETGLQNASPRSSYSRTLDYSFTAFNVYAVTLLVALAIRSAMRNSRAFWTPITIGSHWTNLLPQIMIVFISSWLVATTFFIALTLWIYALRIGWPSIKESPVTYIAGLLEYNGPMVIPGSILALIVLAILDAHRERFEGSLVGRRRNSTGSVSEGLDEAIRPGECSGISLKYAKVSAAAMGVAGMIARVLSYYFGSPVPLSETNGALMGLVIYAGIFSTIVGFLVTFCVSEVTLYRLSFKPGRGLENGGP